MDRVESYKYLGSTFHATRGLSYGVTQLISAAKKAFNAGVVLFYACMTLGYNAKRLTDSSLSKN